MPPKHEPPPFITRLARTTGRSQRSRLVLVFAVAVLGVFAIPFVGVNVPLFKTVSSPPSPSPSAPPPSSEEPLYNEHSNRVALCFFGLTRSLRRTLPGIKKNLLGRLRVNFTVDVFLHTYSLKNLTNPRAGEVGVALDTEEWRVLEPLVDKVVEEPEKVDATIDFDSILRHGNAFPEDTSATSQRNVLRMLRSVRQCWDLVVKHSHQTRTEYKYAVFARPDVDFVQPLPDLDALFAAKLSTTPGLLPSKLLGMSMVDRFAVGHPSAVSAWATRGDLAMDFVQGVGTNFPRPLHSETLVKYALWRRGVTALHVPMCFYRVRANGKVSDLDRSFCKSWYFPVAYNISACPLFRHEPPVADCAKRSTNPLYPKNATGYLWNNQKKRVDRGKKAKTP